jgi:hypothetical protein
MRKIGDVASGPFEIECVLVEKRIEFHDKRHDFTWLRARYSPGSAGANALQVLNQLRQWRQSESNLDQDAAYEREGEEAKRQRDRGHRFAQGALERVLGSRSCNDDASVP